MRSGFCRYLRNWGMAVANSKSGGCEWAQLSRVPRLAACADSPRRTEHRPRPQDGRRCRCRTHQPAQPLAGIAQPSRGITVGIRFQRSQAALLRDNRSLTRQAYVEFDVVAMMEGQAFSDFGAALADVPSSRVWRLRHRNRAGSRSGRPRHVRRNTGAR